MDARPDDGAPHALLRMLMARTRRSDGAAYIVRDGRMRLWAAGPNFGRASTKGWTNAWRPVDDCIAGVLAQGQAASVEGAALGLEAPRAAIQPLVGPDDAPCGFLIIGCGQRIGKGLAAALEDAAALGTPMAYQASSCCAPAVRARLPAPSRASPARLYQTMRSIAEGTPAHRMIEEARKGPGACSLYLIEIDRVPAIEMLGASAGQALLAAIEARFMACLGAGDRLTRLEERRFVVVAGRRREIAGGFAASLLAAARQPVVLEGRPISVQASIGAVAELPDHLPTEAAAKQAAAALRQAKAEGRNHYVILEAGDQVAALEVSQLELDLSEAAARNQMRLEYQPYIDLRHGAVSGAEALLRWRHPSRGELQPAAFIPLAESTGLILPLGTWALRAALRAARGWPQSMTVSVNVSAIQFHQPDFVAEVDAALAEAGVAPGRLELEITETVLMRANPQTTAQLAALIARGVRIALDDFGTGYSALAYLAWLPHHRIKLDRSFVQDLGNPATLELVRAIIALATKAGVEVTAEGIERPDQLETVRNLGFSHAQGYATGRPVADPIEPNPPERVES